MELKDYSVSSFNNVTEPVHQDLDEYKNIQILLKDYGEVMITGVTKRDYSLLRASDLAKINGNPDVEQIEEVIKSLRKDYEYLGKNSVVVSYPNVSIDGFQVPCIFFVPMLDSELTESLVSEDIIRIARDKENASAGHIPSENIDIVEYSTHL